jgi:hypothetical protein
MNRSVCVFSESSCVRRRRGSYERIGVEITEAKAVIDIGVGSGLRQRSKKQKDVRPN